MACMGHRIICDLSGMLRKAVRKIIKCGEAVQRSAQGTGFLESDQRAAWGAG